MVEDNMEHIELCYEYLPKERYELVAALTGCDALEKIKTNDFDIVVLDYALPDMNGMDLLRKMRRMGSDVPTIFITAMDEPGLSLEAMKAGACDYIVKTFGYYQNLRSRIEENLEACGLPKHPKL